MNALKKTRVLNCHCQRIKELSPILQNVSCIHNMDSMFQATWSYYAGGCQERPSSIRRRIEQNARIVAPTGGQKTPFRRDWTPFLSRNEGMLPPGVDLEDHIYRELVSPYQNAEVPAKLKKEVKFRDFGLEQWLSWKREEEQVQQTLIKSKDPYLKEELYKKLARLKKLTSRRPLIVLQNQKEVSPPETPTKSLVKKSKRGLESMEPAKQPGLTPKPGPYVNRISKAAVETSPEMKLRKRADTGSMGTISQSNKKDLSTFRKEHPGPESHASTKHSRGKVHRSLKRREMRRHSAESVKISSPYGIDASREGVRNSELDNEGLSKAYDSKLETSKKRIKAKDFVKRISAKDSLEQIRAKAYEKHIKPKASKKHLKPKSSRRNLINTFSKMSFKSQIIKQNPDVEEKNEIKKSISPTIEASFSNDSLSSSQLFPKIAKNLSKENMEIPTDTNPSQHQKIPENYQEDMSREASHHTSGILEESHHQIPQDISSIREASHHKVPQKASTIRKGARKLRTKYVRNSTTTNQSKRSSKSRMESMGMARSWPSSVNYNIPFGTINYSRKGSVRKKHSAEPAFRSDKTREPSLHQFPQDTSSIREASLHQVPQDTSSIGGANLHKVSLDTSSVRKESHHQVSLDTSSIREESYHQVPQDTSSIREANLYKDPLDTSSIRLGSSTKYDWHFMTKNQAKPKSAMSSKVRIRKARSWHSPVNDNIPFRARKNLAKKEYTAISPARELDAGLTLSLKRSQSLHGWPLPVGLRRYHDYIKPYGQYKNLKVETTQKDEVKTDSEIDFHALRRPSDNNTVFEAKTPKSSQTVTYSVSYHISVEQIPQYQPLIIADVKAEFMKTFGSEISFKESYPFLLKPNELDPALPEVPLKQPQVKKTKKENAKKGKVKKGKAKKGKTKEKKSLEKMPSKREKGPCSLCNLVRRRQSELRPYMKQMQKERQRLELRTYYTEKILQNRCTPKQDTREKRSHCVKQVLATCYEALSLCQRLVEQRLLQKLNNVSR